MTKAIRTTLSLGASLVLFSSLMAAQAAGNNADKNKDKVDTSKQHHSRLAKAAVWRHHKAAAKNAKETKATPAPSKPAQAKTAQIKPASAKQATVKQATGNKEQKQQPAANTSKPSSKKAPAVNQTKPQQKTQDPKTVSSKQ
jgi:hypothetical protein